MNIIPNAIEAANTNNWFYRGFIAPYTHANIFTKICGGICGGVAVASITALVSVVFSKSNGIADSLTKLFGGLLCGCGASLGILAAAHIIPGLTEIVAVTSVILVAGKFFA